MKRLASLALAAFGCCFALSAHAQEQELLEPEQAFAFSASQKDGQVVVRYDIADGYYMYRERFAFASANGEIDIGQASFPEGIGYEDEFFGKMQIYRGSVEIGMPASALSGAPAVLKAVSQGCADIGVCYPPMTSEATLALAAAGGAGPGSDGSDEPGFFNDEESFVESVLGSGSGLFAVGVFLVFGVLLSFTPCVLPMVPILAGILSKGAGSPMRTGMLCCAFVLGLASTFTALGVAAGYGGSIFAYALQQPPALVLYSAVLVLFAASLFDLVQFKGTSLLAGGGKGGAANGIAGAFSMGMFSSLITSACVAPPLAAALLYISKTGDALLGGSSLFAMALGMSMPVVAAGLSSGALVMRMGARSVLARILFGYLMLAVAAWLVAPLMSVPAQMLLQGLIISAGAIHFTFRLYEFADRRVRPLRMAAPLAALAAGLAYIGGGATGGADPLNPLAHLWKENVRSESPLQFARLERPGNLDGLVASLDGKGAMLYFTADWCVSCTELERFTFSDPEVADQLSGYTLVKIDLTDMASGHKALMRRYELVGPPGMVFIDGGNRILGKLVGYRPPKRFLKALARIRAGGPSV